MDEESATEFSGIIIAITPGSRHGMPTYGGIKHHETPG
jgi:hypothetical protein